MSSRASGRVRRIVLVCLAMLALGAGTARASAAGAETPSASSASEASVHAAPSPSETQQAPAKDWLSTAMNAGAIGFCMWMLALMWRPGLGRSLRRPSDS